MTPERAIAKLDRKIGSLGQTVSLKRGTGALVAMRGYVRGFKPSELVGMLQQGDRSIILSPSVLGAFGIPRRGDKAVLADGSATVQAVEPLRINDVLVRVNLVVRGD